MTIHSGSCSVNGCGAIKTHGGMCNKHYRRWKRHGDPEVVLRIVHAGTDSERFWKRVNKTGQCWEWIGGTFRNGYGSWCVRQKNHCAHRFAYEDIVGPIPEGVQLDHTCHNRRCVNPAHLRLATNKQNNENPSGLRSDNTSGYRGVYFDKKAKKWCARAQHNNQTYKAGYFTNLEEAAEAARQLRLSLFTHNDADRRGGAA